MFSNRVALSLLLLAAGCLCAQAQVTMTGAGLPRPVAGATYTGPGDCSGCAAGATMWFGLRAFSAATRGNAAISLCDDTGANCADALTDATTGNLVITTRGVNNCASSGTCTISTMYDQTAGNNCSAATCNMVWSVARPKLLPNCIGSLPCALFPGFMQTANTLNVLPSVTYSVVFNTAVGNTGSAPFYTATQIPEIIANTSNILNLYNGTVSANVTAAWGTFFAVQAVFNATAASSDLNLNGSVNTVNPNNTGSSGTAMRLSDSVWSGKITEAGVWLSKAFSAGESSSMSSNQRGYWGF